MHLATVTEILQSIRQSDMSPILQRIFQAEGGTELLDVLMKYLLVLTQEPSLCVISSQPDRARGVGTRACLQSSLHLPETSPHNPLASRKSSHEEAVKVVDRR